MWMIKWVELDDVLNYHPIVEFVDDYNTAREIFNSVEERFDKQELDPEKLDSGKVCCDPIFEQIDPEKDLNVRSFEGDKLFFCKKCNSEVHRLVANTMVGVELLWDNAEGYYEVVEDSYILEDSTSVICPVCASDLLKQK